MSKPVALRAGHHALVLSTAGDPMSRLPEHLWTPDTATATWVEAEVAESSIADLVGCRTASWIWGVNSRRLATGDRIRVETFVKKTRSNKDLFLTRIELETSK